MFTKDQEQKGPSTPKSGLSMGHLTADSPTEKRLRHKTTHSCGCILPILLKNMQLKLKKNRIVPKRFCYESYLNILKDENSMHSIVSDDDLFLDTVRKAKEDNKYLESFSVHENSLMPADPDRAVDSKP